MFRPFKSATTLDDTLSPVAVKDFSTCITNFLASGDLSFASFKNAWREVDLGIIHHTQPNYTESRLFLQAIYGAALSLLSPSIYLPGGRLELPSALGWKIGVLYLVYSLYKTQSHWEDPEPVRVCPSTWNRLMDVGTILSECDLGGIGDDALYIFHALLDKKAFVLAAYDGPPSLSGGLNYFTSYNQHQPRMSIEPYLNFFQELQLSQYIEECRRYTSKQAMEEEKHQDKEDEETPPPPPTRPIMDPLLLVAEVQRRIFIRNADSFTIPMEMVVYQGNENSAAIAGLGADLADPDSYMRGGNARRKKVSEVCDEAIMEVDGYEEDGKAGEKEREEEFDEDDDDDVLFMEKHLEEMRKEKQKQRLKERQSLEAASAAAPGTEGKEEKEEEEEDKDLLDDLFGFEEQAPVPLARYDLGLMSSESSSEEEEEEKAVKSTKGKGRARPPPAAGASASRGKRVSLKEESTLSELESLLLGWEGKKGMETAEILTPSSTTSRRKGIPTGGARTSRSTTRGRGRGGRGVKATVVRRGEQEDLLGLLNETTREAALDLSQKVEVSPQASADLLSQQLQSLTTTEHRAKEVDNFDTLLAELEQVSVDAANTMKRAAVKSNKRKPKGSQAKTVASSKRAGPVKATRRPRKPKALSKEQAIPAADDDGGGLLALLEEATRLAPMRGAMITTSDAGMQEERGTAPVDDAGLSINAMADEALAAFERLTADSAVNTGPPSSSMKKADDVLGELESLLPTDTPAAASERHPINRDYKAEEDDLTFLMNLGAPRQAEVETTPRGEDDSNEDDMDILAATRGGSDAEED